MDDTMKKYLEEFVTLCYSRLEKGEKIKKGAYKKVDLYDQILEELTDVSNYAFLEFMRIQNLKKMKRKITQLKRKNTKKIKKTTRR